MIIESFTDGAWLCQPPLPSRDALTKPALAHPPSACFSWFHVRRQCGPSQIKGRVSAGKTRLGANASKKPRQFLQKQRTVYKYIPESWGLGWPFFILLLRRMLSEIPRSLWRSLTWAKLSMGLTVHPGSIAQILLLLVLSSLDWEVEAFSWR